MGQSTRGIYPDKGGAWQIDRSQHKTRLRQRGFGSFAEAETWLTKQLEQLRVVKVHGERPARSFDEAATHYLLTNQNKISLVTDTYHLKSVMPFIGTLDLRQIHDGTLAPFVNARLVQGRAHKTVNLALSAVNRILRLAATAWRDQTGQTWLHQAPQITMLPLVGHQRDPRPITWSEQRGLLPKLPAHLARMALFVLNTGVRDDVVCSLRWEWEIKVPQLGVSVFEVPRQHVKGRRRSRVVVCNSVAQSVIESVRGQHDEFVFVYRRERVKNLDQPAAMLYRPIETMNNTAWQRGRREAGLGDLHVHDLRHTVGMRLREAGVSESTISDVLWHSTKSVTRHYSVAQLVELHSALETVKSDSGQWNLSLDTLRRQHREAAMGSMIYPNATQQRKTA